MDLADGYTWAWIAWGVAFLGIEGYALARKAPGDTLSEHIWRWFSIKHDGKAKGLRRGILGAGLAWLAWHLMGG